MLTPLISRIRSNCELASSLQAGSYSLCGFLMRLRQLYKWEHSLPPWREPEPEAVLEWVAAQEGAWEAREEDSWEQLEVNGRTLDPFQAEELNRLLAPAGLAYGAGLSRGLSPTFFLGELLELRRQEELTILVLGRELARDLDGTPALCQGRLIYARLEPLAYYLWDRLADPAQQGCRYVAAALGEEGLELPQLLRDPEGHGEAWRRLLLGELEAVIRHEVGEAREDSLAAALPLILQLFPQTRLELAVRALKDALAEVNHWGRLAFLIQGRRLASLALMLAFQPGIYTVMLPELEPAFQHLTSTGDWDHLEHLRLAALARLRRLAREVEELCTRHRDEPDTLRRLLQARLLSPLGL
jgi:hypothetical protein